MFNSKYVALVSYLIDEEEGVMDYDHYETDSCEIRIDGSLLITLNGEKTCLLNSGEWSDVSLIPASAITISDRCCVDLLDGEREF
ncbi:hypothetical protein ACK36J_00995 [Aeromonas veronii]